MSNSDSKLVVGLLEAWHIVEFGVICLVCCIPIITAGAATSAMFRMYFRMRNGESVGFKAYFDEFGKVFKNSTFIELAQIASGILIAIMAIITFKASGISSAGILLLAPVSLLFLIWVLVFAYAYAHEAYFGLDMKTTIKSCFTMTFGCLLSTTALLILFLILPMLYFLMPSIFIMLIPVWVILLVPLINWWDSYFYKKAFETSSKDDGMATEEVSETPSEASTEALSETPEEGTSEEK